MRTSACLALALCTLAGSASAQLGTSLRKFTVPVPTTTCCGIGVAVDCNGFLYYTNTETPTLFKVDANGTLLSSTPIADATGTPVTVGAIVWDDGRKLIWGGSDTSVTPVRVYTIDPTTGIATFRFTAINSITFGFCDGLAYDASDDSIWLSDDVSTVVDHLAATTGADLGALTPLDQFGSPLGSISGVTVGTNNLLYLGRNGFGEIVRVDRTTGAFFDVFSTPGGRDEDLECDAVNFRAQGKLVLWSKDAYDDTLTAIEVEPGTCSCGGCPGVFSNYGSGLAGTGGIEPEISSGCPQVGSTVTLTMSDGLANAHGCLLAGTARRSIAVAGGTILVQFQVVLPHDLDAEGLFSLPIPIPNDPSLLGLQLDWQSFYMDPGAVYGVSMTEGLEWVIG